MTRQSGGRQQATSRRPAGGRQAAAGAAAVMAALVLPALSAASAGAAATVGHGGAGRTAAVAGGSLVAWGDNEAAQLGDGTRTNSDVPVPVRIPAGVRITSARGSCAHSIALASDGKVFEWGTFPLNGPAVATSAAGRGSAPGVIFPPGTKIKAIRAGCGYSLALTSDGKVLGWGANDHGQLGNGTTTKSGVPVAAALPAGTKVTAISAGRADSLALTSTGRVYAWGANNDGQLGDGTVTDSDVPVQVMLAGGVTVTAVTAGDSHNLARTSEGKVLAWGLNSDGELGNGSTASSDTPVRAALPKGTKVAGLFAGCAHTLALTTKGKVLAWGSDSDGQLGNGRTGGHRDTPVRARLPKGTKVAAISAGCDHSMARTAKGHVLAWGLGHNGELGNGSTASGDIPVRVKLPAGLKATALGSGPDADFSFAITR